MKKRNLILSLLLFLSGQTIAQKPGYKLIFSEEFNSGIWNSTEWERKNFYGGDPLMNVFVGDSHHDNLGPGQSKIYDLSTLGVLKFMALDQNAPASMHSDPAFPKVPPGASAHNLNTCKFDFNKDGNIDCAEDYNYTSGEFWSKREFMYGYFEIRCKIPKARTFWQSFWLYGQNGPTEPGPWYNEIDVFEQVDKDIEGNIFQTLEGNIHYLAEQIDGTIDIGVHSIDLPFSLFPNTTVGNYDQTYYTFGLEWDPNYTIWYVNDIPVRIVPCNNYTPKHLMHLIVSFALRNNYTTLDGGITVNNLAPYPSSFPANYEIDYIRAYQKLQVQDFGSGPSAGEWNKTIHKRMIADVDGDGKDDIVGFGNSQVLVSLAQVQPIVPGIPILPGHPVRNTFQSYSTPWINGFCHAQGWNMNSHPRFLQDVNGDEKDDIIGFSDAGVLLSHSNGSSFNSPSLVIQNFGAGSTAGGWDYTKHRRFVKDINNDGRADIVGFGSSQVFVALGTVNGFAPVSVWLTGGYFTYSQGWYINNHPIELADVNGDNQQDIIGFWNNGVYVSYGTGSSFTIPTQKLSIFGYSAAAGNWRTTMHLRLMGDVNADGKDDIVAFGEDNVTVCKGTTTGFTPPVVWTNDFGRLDVWSVANTPRYLADVNGDNRMDIVGYTGDGVKVATSLNTTFSSTFLWRNYYGNYYEAGYFHPDNDPRMMGDFNGDGKADIITFSKDGVMASLSPNCFGPTNVEEIEPFPYLHRSRMETTPTNTELSVIAYPNPFNDIFTIEIKNYNPEEEFTYEIHDLRGRLIQNNRIHSETTQLDLSKETNGVYLVTIKNGERIKRLKIAKTNN